MSASATAASGPSLPATLGAVAACLVAPTLVAHLAFADGARRAIEGEFGAGAALAVVPLVLVFTHCAPITRMGRRFRSGLVAVAGGWIPTWAFMWLLYALGVNPAWAQHVALLGIALPGLLAVLPVPISFVAGLAAAVEGESLGFVAACALAIGCMQLAVPFWGLLASAWLGR